MSTRRRPRVRAAARDERGPERAGVEAASEVVVRLNGAGRVFGSAPAVAGVDLSISSGERVAVLGASEAGKTTLLSLTDQRLVVGHL
jgi:ABC-type transport system involved in cytochrome bd biosynthesis fused ATPase/permease subunit